MVYIFVLSSYYLYYFIIKKGLDLSLHRITQSPVPGSAASGSPRYHTPPGPVGCCGVSGSLPWACSTLRWRVGSAETGQHQPQQAEFYDGGHLDGWAFVTRRRGRGEAAEMAPWLLICWCALPDRRDRTSWVIYIHNKLNSFFCND